MWRLIVILILALVVAVFAIDNARPVSVHFLFWSLPRMGLALVILASALLGAVLGVALGLSQVFRERRSRRHGMVSVPISAHVAPDAPSQATTPKGRDFAVEAAVTRPEADGERSHDGSGPGSE